MLHPHPVAVGKLVKRYQALREEHALHGGPQTRQRLNDAAYTLCVITGTRDIDAALDAARRFAAPASDRLERAV